MKNEDSLILVTGAAGFIGAALSQQLLKLGFHVVGIDNLNDYYDVNLKHDRLKQLEGSSDWTFHKIDLADQSAMEKLFSDYQFDIVINLAAQAGVRHSVTHPHVYVESNVVGFLHVLDGCRQTKVKHLLFASTSSVYGASEKLPYSETDSADQPIALYGATKRANELMAHSYSYLYQLPCTGLRFFTVYGPWGRPDMALFQFTQKILSGHPIDVFNHGDMIRNFTYIDDIVEGICRLIDKPRLFEIYNLGNPRSVKLLAFIQEIEKNLDRKAELRYLPMQAGDVKANVADTSKLKLVTGWVPNISIEEGVKRFIQWYREYEKG